MFGLSEFRTGAWRVLHAGSYLGYSLLVAREFWAAALLGGLAVGMLGVLLERFLIHPSGRVLRYIPIGVRCSLGFAGSRGMSRVKC